MTIATTIGKRDYDVETYEKGKDMSKVQNYTTKGFLREYTCTYAHETNPHAANGITHVPPSEMSNRRQHSSRTLFACFETPAAAINSSELCLPYSQLIFLISVPTYPNTTMSSAAAAYVQANNNEYFVQCTSGPNTGQWMCKLCSSRTFKDKSRHSKLTTHIDRVRLAIEEANGPRRTMGPPGLASRSTFANSAPSLPRESPADSDVRFEDPPNPVDNTCSDDPMSDIFDNHSDDLESLYDASHWIEIDLSEAGQSSMDLDDFMDNASENDQQSETGSKGDNDPTPITNPRLPWYPLRKKEHAAALLIMGTGRNLTSTAEYNRLRCILKLVMNVHLPDLVWVTDQDLHYLA
ncbi:uncharacterized protein MELLADRAFT_107442 [Melampsora larici-populina 98AG31]|uniref:Uncharacterized protein n=1 Tax=Melampsora larici-populina (strain 98AG31 / pathotype 3-4-7) TaxID=747676 RepID=F4RPU1_MELLP|nr:uncharacterized protein MELLADRAFT_107442 [Melampsora larici-populina 98AG31]EGG05605.1 hypothetical protein MELLADRAFT_107442 [Melampsora larici-populina 98AG31]